MGTDCTTGIPCGHHTSAAALVRNDIHFCKIFHSGHTVFCKRQMQKIPTQTCRDFFMVTRTGISHDLKKCPPDTFSPRQSRGRSFDSHERNAKSPDANASGLFAFLPWESKDRPQLCRGKKCPADIFSDYRKIVSLRASAHTGVAIRFLLYFRIHRKMKKLKPVMRAKAGQIICPTTASPSVPQSGRTAVPPGQPVPGTPLRNLLPGTVPCIPPDSSVSGGNSGAAGAW